jgi:beta-aspartyl-dipeptidase (metallo-type)
VGAIILITGGEVHAPEPLGRKSVLIVGDRIARLGGVDAEAASRALGLDVEVIDAAGCLVTPGIVDPHVHLTGGSGEEGFASRTPSIQLTELAPWGTTTVVGCLGVDATTRNLPGLLAQVKALNEEGLTAFQYTGSYGLPPVTFTGAVRDDLLFIAEVLGVGEIAISDERAPQPTPAELARVVIDAKVGGMLSGKAGVTHFHTGEQPERLAPLRALLDDFHIAPELIYPSHVHRTEELLAEAVDLSKRGCCVDMDVRDEKTPHWIQRFFDLGGHPERLSISSDADGGAPGDLFRTLRTCVLDQGLPLDLLLPLVTANPARVLKLNRKGRLEPGRDADLLVIRRETWEIVDVIAKGQPLVRNGEIVKREGFLESSDRVLELKGKMAEGGTS